LAQDLQSARRRLSNLALLLGRMALHSAVEREDSDEALLLSMESKKEHALNASDKDLWMCDGFSCSGESTYTTSAGLGSVSDCQSSNDDEAEFISLSFCDADPDIEDNSWDWEADLLLTEIDFMHDEYEIETRQEQLRGARRTQKALRRYLRPQLVRPSLLTASGPWPVKIEKEDMRKVGPGQQEEETLSEKKTKKKEEPRVRPFQKLRESFQSRVANELYRTFGPEALISPTSLSKRVEDRFMRRMRSCRGNPEASLLLAFHGTKKTNFSGICRQGFLLPGIKGGVPIANGNAHGAGIYTAREGSAVLSKTFCDSRSMLVCGVIDACDSDPDDNEDEDGLKMLRIGRAPKRPSSWSRVAMLGNYQAPRMLGNYQVTKESKEVRHVGDALVVFNPNCVVPLFQVDGVPSKLYQSAWQTPSAKKQDELEASRVISRQVEALWPSEGNPNIVRQGDHKAEMAPATSHERNVKRCVVRRQRQRARRQARVSKFNQRSFIPL